MTVDHGYTGIAKLLRRQCESIDRYQRGNIGERQDLGFHLADQAVQYRNLAPVLTEPDHLDVAVLALRLAQGVKRRLVSRIGAAVAGNNDFELVRGVIKNSEVADFVRDELLLVVGGQQNRDRRQLVRLQCFARPVIGIGLSVFFAE